MTGGKKYTKYQTDEELNNSIVNEPEIGYLINHTHTGMPFQSFEQQSKRVPFSQNEWSNLLHLSERTFQRYKKDNKRFESIYTEKILEIILLFNRGKEVLGSEDAFYEWLNTPCLALDNIKPITIIDNSFGIEAVRNELGRIEHGVFS